MRSVDRLQQLLAADDRNGAQLLSHSLKGAAATLGAVEISAAAGAIELAIKAGATNEQLAVPSATLAEPLGALIAAIAEIPAAAPAGTRQATDWPSFKALLASLEKPLAFGDLAAHELCHAHAAEIRSALGGLGDEMLSNVEHFDFDKALENIAQARQSHPELTS